MALIDLSWRVVLGDVRFLLHTYPYNLKVRYLLL